MALGPNRAPGRLEVVESKGAPKSTVSACSKGQSQPIYTSICGFNIFQQLLYVGGDVERALVQHGGVVSAAELPGVPADLVQVPQGVVLLAGKAEEPVAGGVGGDVGLVHLGQGEGLHNSLVGTLAGHGVLLVEGALVLVDHDAVSAQGLGAVAVKLTGEQTLTGAEGVGGIHDDEVILFHRGTDVPQAVLVVDGHTGVVQAAGGEGEIPPAHLHHLGIDLHQVDVFNLRIAAQLPHHAAVAAADDQHVLHVVNKQS